MIGLIKTVLLAIFAGITGVYLCVTDCIRDNSTNENEAFLSYEESSSSSSVVSFGDSVNLEELLPKTSGNNADPVHYYGKQK
jgi:hypothetical protein